MGRIVCNAFGGQRQSSQRQLGGVYLLGYRGRTMCVSLGRHMLSAARLSTARRLALAPVPFVASDPQDWRRITPRLG